MFWRGPFGRSERRTLRLSPPLAAADANSSSEAATPGRSTNATSPSPALSAKRVGPIGIAYGLDMTDEMLDLARESARVAGITNVRWLKGFLEEIPLPDESVDVVISNCVINLSPDKAKVLDEAARGLKPGGQFAVTDVIADPDMTDEIRQDMNQWTACIAGALTRDKYDHLLTTAGLTGVEIRETHRVQSNAGSAIIRARKPAV